MITCRTLGPVDIGVDGGAAPAELLWRKNVALLVYLARSPARRRTRDHLIGLLWGDREESAARHSLREAVRAIRRAAGDDQLGTEGDQLSLGESAVELDTDRFERLAAAGDWAGAAALVTGDFLEGFSVPDASPFEDWLGAERAYWRRRAVEALVNQGDRALSAGDIPQAAHLAERATALDPAAARAARLAMKALSLGGDRNAALAAYGRFAEQSSGTGTEPDRETRALAELLRRDREWRLPDYTRATSDRGAESRRVPLVGREPQLGAALEQWNGCRADRRARVVVVEGDPGLGKTRLADEILARARLDGAAVTAVRAVAADFAQLGSGLLGLARGGLIDASGVAGAPPPAIAALAAVASAWAERFPGSTRGSAPRPLATAFAEVLAAASRDQPVLVLVDDAQWLDDDSLLALEAVVRDLGTAAVMVLLTAAPQPERPKLAELRARIGRELMGTTIRLEPLTPDALRQLARWAVPRGGSRAASTTRVSSWLGS